MRARRSPSPTRSTAAAPGGRARSTRPPRRSAPTARLPAAARRRSSRDADGDRRRPCSRRCRSVPAPPARRWRVRRAPGLRPRSVLARAVRDRRGARAPRRRRRPRHAAADRPAHGRHRAAPRRCSRTPAAGRSSRAAAPARRRARRRARRASAARPDRTGGSTTSTSCRAPRATLSTPRPRPRELAGDRLPARYARGAWRFRYGPGHLQGRLGARRARSRGRPRCAADAGTVHVGGTFEEVRRGEADVAAGRHPERPFCIVVQPASSTRPARPTGQHTLWAYCHVPIGLDVDMTDAIEAPDRALRARVPATWCSPARRRRPSTRAHEPQLRGRRHRRRARRRCARRSSRPTLAGTPTAAPVEGLYLCSASTPPGGGVKDVRGRSRAHALRDGVSRGTHPHRDGPTYPLGGRQLGASARRRRRARGRAGSRGRARHLPRAPRARRARR